MRKEEEKFERVGRVANRYTCAAASALAVYEAAIRQLYVDVRTVREGLAVRVSVG